MKRYLAVIEQAERNLSAYSPDLPGCVATGRTRKEVEANMQGANRMHIAGLREDSLPAPEPNATAEYIAV